MPGRFIIFVQNIEKQIAALKRQFTTITFDLWGIFIFKKYHWKEHLKNYFTCTKSSSKFRSYACRSISIMVDQILNIRDSDWAGEKTTFYTFPMITQQWLYYKSSIFDHGSQILQKHHLISTKRREIDREIFLSWSWIQKQLIIPATTTTKRWLSIRETLSKVTTVHRASYRMNHTVWLNKNYIFSPEVYIYVWRYNLYHIKVYKSIFKKWIFLCLLPDEKISWITQAISQAINSSSYQLPFSSTTSLKLISR